MPNVTSYKKTTLRLVAHIYIVLKKLKKWSTEEWWSQRWGEGGREKTAECGRRRLLSYQTPCRPPPLLIPPFTTLQFSFQLTFLLSSGTVRSFSSLILCSVLNTDLKVAFNVSIYKQRGCYIKSLLLWVFNEYCKNIVDFIQFRYKCIPFVSQ